VRATIRRVRRLRVLHITPSVRLLGARRSLLTLVKHLHGTRIEPLVVVPSRGALTEEFDRLRLPYVVLPLPPWRKAYSWKSMWHQVSALRELVMRQQIDLVHCNEIYPNPHALVAASAGRSNWELMSRLLQGRGLAHKRIPVVTHMRLSVTPPMIRKYYLSEAARIIAVSEGAARDFDGYDWKAQKVRVVYNGLDFEEFEDAREHRHRTREELGFRPDDFVIGQIGLMMPRKRPKFLLEAAPEILKHVPQARFLFVGESSPGQANYLENLKQSVQALGLGHAVRFLPFQAQIARYFGALDLNMLVSDDEGFGRVVVEAAAAHAPSVGSRVGGIPELIEDGETGFLLGKYGAKDEEFWKEIPQFVEHVKLLSSSGGIYESMAARAHTMAKEKFSAETYVKRVAEVFDEAVAEFDVQRDQW
jgi:L-malate glycosyltransferase